MTSKKCGQLLAWLAATGAEYVGNSDDYPEYAHRLIDRVSGDDRDWFERHPSAVVRQRPLVPGEFGPQFRLDAPPGGWLMVEVVQVEPGLRTRRPYWALVVS